MPKITSAQPQAETTIAAAKMQNQFPAPLLEGEEELWREMSKLTQEYQASKLAAASTQAVHKMVIRIGEKGSLAAPAIPIAPTTMNGSSLANQHSSVQNQPYCWSCHNTGEINKMMPVGVGDDGGVKVQYYCPECLTGQSLLEKATKEQGSCPACNRGWELSLADQGDQYHLKSYNCQPCSGCENGRAISLEIATKRAAARSRRLNQLKLSMSEELCYKSFANFEQREVQFEIGKNNDGTPRMVWSNRGEALTFVRARVTSKPCNILLLGRPGAGKSHLAAAAFFARWEAGEEGVFITFNHLGDKLKATYSNPDGPRYDDLLQYYQRLPVLVLDDLGTQKPSEADIKIATELINYRFSNPKLWTMITTNLSGPQLAEWFGERLKSRLGKQYFDRFVIVAPDWRAEEW